MHLFSLGYASGDTAHLLVTLSQFCAIRTVHTILKRKKVCLQGASIQDKHEHQQPFVLLPCGDLSLRLDGLQDGRQKGEVQLAFTFQPYDQSSPSPHGSQANLDTFRAHQPSPSSRAGSARTTADSSAESSPQKHKGKPEPALDPALTVEGLGPLGNSFMTLAMTHITPSKPDSAETLDDHTYLKLAAGTENPRAMPTAPPPGQTLDQASHSAPAPAVQLQRRNFYPEEASDDEEVKMPPQHHLLAVDAPSTMPMEFRCQQPAAEAGATEAASCCVDNASYSSQEVYHAYSTRQADGSQSGYVAHRGQAQAQGQGHEQQPQVPQWRLLGTSPLHEGQQSVQGQCEGQAQGQWQGREQQPQVPQWRLLGTSPLHEGQRQNQEQPQVCPPAQSQGPQGQGRGQGYQQQPQRPDWHLMGISPLHDGCTGVDCGANASLSFSNQNRDSAVRPLTYASMAVGSWSEAKHYAAPAGQQNVLQVCCAAVMLLDNQWNRLVAKLLVGDARLCIVCASEAHRYA